MAQRPADAGTAVGAAPRLDPRAVAPESVRGLNVLETFVRSGHLERRLLELVRMRASQINGCAYCLDLHGRLATEAGEAPHRLFALPAWREAPFYSERERAALAWTEALTLIHEGHAPDDVYDEVRRHFDDRELVELTMAIVAINAWNRIAIAFREVPGRRPTEAATAGSDGRGREGGASSPPPAKARPGEAPLA